MPIRGRMKGVRGSTVGRAFYGAISRFIFFSFLVLLPIVSFFRPRLAIGAAGLASESTPGKISRGGAFDSPSCLGISSIGPVAAGRRGNIPWRWGLLWGHIPPFFFSFSLQLCPSLAIGSTSLMHASRRWGGIPRTRSRDSNSMRGHIPLRSRRCWL